MRKSCKFFLACADDAVTVSFTRVKCHKHKEMIWRVSLPPGGLKPFVLSRPKLFQIVDSTAHTGVWGIQMTPWATRLDTPSPAVGGSSASTDRPASAMQATASQGTIPPVGGSEGTIPASQPAEEPRPQVPAWFQGWTGNGVSNDQDNEYNDWVGWHHWQENEWRGQGWRWY